MQILSLRVLLAVSECLSFQSSLKLKEERLLCGTEKRKKKYREREREGKNTSSSSGFLFVLLPKTPKVAKVTEII